MKKKKKKKKKDFSSLFTFSNTRSETPHVTFSQNTPGSTNADTLFNEHISLFEVKQVAVSAKVVKHVGMIMYHQKFFAMTQRFLVFIFCLIFVLTLVLFCLIGENALLTLYLKHGQTIEGTLFHTEE